MRYFIIFVREKMLKLKDINIFYVKFMFMMGWDELNVLKKWGFLIFIFYIYFLIVYLYV